MSHAHPVRNIELLPPSKKGDLDGRPYELDQTKEQVLRCQELGILRACDSYGGRLHHLTTFDLELQPHVIVTELEGSGEIRVVTTNTVWPNGKEVYKGPAEKKELPPDERGYCLYSFVKDGWTYTLRT